jgi:quercetin dioxygenase-like cupin family protein
LKSPISNESCWLVLATGAVALVVLLRGTTALDDMPCAAPKAETTELWRKPDPEDPNREIITARIVFPPGTSFTAHQHPGVVAGYVLSGDLDFQIEGEPLQHLKSGNSFYEAPAEIHAIARNPRPDTATTVLVFILQRKGQSLVLPLHRPNECTD